MTAERPRYDDDGLFASLTHEVRHGGPGPQEHDFHMRDRDVTLVIETTRRSLRLLHLQNVRADTIAAARTAVDCFLDQLEPTGYPKRAEHTVFKNFDKVRQELRDYVRTARADVEELNDQLEWVDDAFPKKEEHATSEGLSKEHLDLHVENPVAAMQAACEDFLEKLQLIDDSDEPSKQEANTMYANNDEAHQEICEYMETQAEKRGLVFEWNDGSYPRDTLRRSGSRIRYDVYFSQNGSWGSHYGTR